MNKITKEVNNMEFCHSKSYNLKLQAGCRMGQVKIRWRQSDVQSFRCEM